MAFAPMPAFGCLHCPYTGRIYNRRFITGCRLLWVQTLGADRTDELVDPHEYVGCAYMKARAERMQDPEDPFQGMDMDRYWADYCKLHEK